MLSSAETVAASRWPARARASRSSVSSWSCERAGPSLRSGHTTHRAPLEDGEVVVEGVDARAERRRVLLEATDRLRQVGELATRSAFGNA